MSLRFNDYRDITARFDSMSTACGTRDGAPGHAIKKGDSIGYGRKRYGAAETMCAACWHKWQSENRECDYLERGGNYAW